MIDLRSDTQTRPTAAMRDAMRDAVVGDEQKGEDPTVLALEDTAARMLGTQAALFVPSATMANVVCLSVLTRPGSSAVLAADSHIMMSEGGAIAAISGLLPLPVPWADGKFSGADVESASAGRSVEAPVCGLVSVESPHSNSGGKVWTLAELDDVCQTARRLGVATHLDGARIFNAATALDVEPHRIAAGFDLVTVCLSKGLGAPGGALVAGAAPLVVAARRMRQMLGGAMRQTGILAAAGLYALTHHVERLADDHTRARRLAAGICGGPLAIRGPVETNAVLLDPGNVGADEAARALAAVGVLCSRIPRTNLLRAMTHLDIGDADICYAIDRMTTLDLDV